MLLGLKPKSLCIRPLGIAIIFEIYEYGKLTELKKVLIALAGPMVNLSIIFIVFFLKIDLQLKSVLIYSNLLIMLLNLIPLYPLDGGRILKSLIRLKCSEYKTAKLINRISNILIVLITGISSIAVLYIQNVAIILVLIYLWVIVIKENKHYSLITKINEIT